MAVVLSATLHESKPQDNGNSAVSQSTHDDVTEDDDTMRLDQAVWNSMVTGEIRQCTPFGALLTEWARRCSRALTGLMWSMKNGDDIAAACARWRLRSQDALQDVKTMQDALIQSRQVVQGTGVDIAINNALLDVQEYTLCIYSFSIARLDVAARFGQLKISIERLQATFLTKEDDGKTTEAHAPHSEEIIQQGDRHDRAVKRIRCAHKALCRALDELAPVAVALEHQAQCMMTHKVVANGVRRGNTTFMGTSDMQAIRDTILDMTRSVLTNRSLDHICHLRHDPEPDAVVLVDDEREGHAETSGVVASGVVAPSVPHTPTTAPAEQWLRDAEHNKRAVKQKTSRLGGWVVQNGDFQYEEPPCLPPAAHTTTAPSRTAPTTVDCVRKLDGSP